MLLVGVMLLITDIQQTLLQSLQDGLCAHLSHCFSTCYGWWICVYVNSITLTWALTCHLDSVSASCWGSFTWQQQLQVSRATFYQKYSQITPNRATDDDWVHKCFSLGLSWLYEVSGGDMALRHNQTSWLSEYMSSGYGFVHQFCPNMDTHFGYLK